MKITNVQVFLTPNQDKLLAFARIALDDSLQLTSIRVYQGTKGPFVAYPSDPNYKGHDYKQLFYPVTRELRNQIEESILNEYNNEYENHATAVAETHGE